MNDVSGYLVDVWRRGKENRHTQLAPQPTVTHYLDDIKER